MEQNALYQQTGLHKDDFSVLGKRIRKENRAFVMTYAELLLLKAEAIVRNMGVEGDAVAVYREALEASLAKWPQVGQASQEETPYIDANQTSTFLAGPNAALREATALQQIAEQQWIDAFLNGYEVGHRGAVQVIANLNRALQYLHLSRYVTFIRIMSKIILT